MESQFDVIVIGGGILGIAHAYHCLQEGLSVALFEKNKYPEDASVRNFGQIVPSGFHTKWQNYGIESLETYNEFSKQGDFTLRRNGSLYVASNSEEMNLLEELHAINRQNQYDSKLLNKEQCIQKFEHLNNSYVEGGLFFGEEMTIDPRIGVRRMIDFLIEQHGLHYFPLTLVSEIYDENEGVHLQSSDGSQYRGEFAFVCCGSDYKTLFPDEFQSSSLIDVKLQMLQTYKQASNMIQGSLLTGWTIRRYESFHECPSFSSIKEQEHQESFKNKYGIHILFKQCQDGSIVIGDSHEYYDIQDTNVDQYLNNEMINDFILQEAKKIVDFDINIEYKWLGFYTQCKDRDIYNEMVAPNINIVTGIGGKGMTASFGYAKSNVATRIKSKTQTI